MLDATSETMALVSADHQMVSVNRRFNEFFYSGPAGAGGSRIPTAAVPERCGTPLRGPGRVCTLVEATLNDPEQQLTQTLVQRAPAPRELELHSKPVDDAGGVRLGRL